MATSSDNCQDFRELIHLAVDRRAGLWQWLLVKWHVKQCPSCAREWAELRALGQTFGSLTMLRTPSGFTRAVHARVAATRPAWTPVKRRPLPLTWQALVGEALVAVVLVGFATAWIVHTDGAKPLASTVRATGDFVRKAPVPAGQPWVQIQKAAHHDRRAWQRIVAEADRGVRNLAGYFMLPPPWPTWALWGLGGAILLLNLLLEAIPLKPFSTWVPERTQSL